MNGGSVDLDGEIAGGGHFGGLGVAGKELDRVGLLAPVHQGVHHQHRDIIFGGEIIRALQVVQVTGVGGKQQKYIGRKVFHG